MSSKRVGVWRGVTEYLGAMDVLRFGLRIIIEYTMLLLFSGLLVGVGVMGFVGG